MNRDVWPRSAGVLLHISSLPGPYPIGDFGQSARHFIRFLQRSHLKWWQVLPLNMLSGGSSPYSSISSFALEPLYIDMDQLLNDGLLNSHSQSELKGHGLNNRVDFKLARHLKMKIYFDSFLTWRKLKGHHSLEFTRFCEHEKEWLGDFALYCSLSEFFKTFQWPQWPKEIRSRQMKALDSFRTQLAERILFHGFLQYYAYQSLQKLRELCEAAGVSILGDLPIYQDLASCDVWVNQSQYQLDPKTGDPLKVAGVPPDAFSANGQKWGHPLYDWQAMAEDDFRWWKSRIRHQLKLYNAIRLDHFIGLYNHWAVPAKDKDARQGQWQLSKGRELLLSLQQEIPHLPILAEDLGAVVPEVIKLRNDFLLPGMKLVHFGFGDSADLEHRPHHYSENFVAYPGTHDNDTTLGWYRSLKKQSPETAQFVCQYFRSSEEQIVWSIISCLYSSVAGTVIVPMQDILGLGSEARLNFPGKVGYKWDWRMIELDYSLFEDRLAQLAMLYERSCPIPMRDKPSA